MEVNIVNIDYEYELYPNFKKGVMGQRLNKEFNYLFFWLGDYREVFYTEEKYSQEYTDYLKKYLDTLPIYTNEKQNNSADWWGSSYDQVGKKLNSKLFSTLLAKEKNLCPPHVEVIYNIKELEHYLLAFQSDDKFFLRKDVSFSSFGHQLLKKEDIFKSNLDFPFVISPFFRRQQDFGNHYIDGSYSICENLLNERGEFKGCFCHEPDISFQEKLKPVENKIKEMAEGDFEIDSFTYCDEDGLKDYPLVEINYRKSLGRMGIALRRLCGDNKACWLLLKKRKSSEGFYDLKCFIEALDFYKNDNIIITNDLRGELVHICFIAPSDKELSTLVMDFSKAYYLEKVPQFLANKFAVNIKN